MSPRPRPLQISTFSPKSPTTRPLQAQPVETRAPGSLWLRCTILLLGLIVPQWIMYGTSLMGSKILLPLDLLAQPNQYLPPTSEYEPYLPVHNSILSDQVLSLEFSRRFCTSEIRSGRLPLWCPNYFLGAPITKWPKYSPFSLIYYLFPTPTALAWMQLAKCLVAGIGAYLFFRRSLGVGYWPAACGAWCYPLTGFLILWQGYTMSYTVAWLPWLLWSVEATVNRPGRLGGIGLALATWLTVMTGQVDVGGLVLMACGIYGLWCLADRWYRSRAIASLTSSMVALVAGWTLGLLLTAPYLLPMIEYSRTGHRMQQRGAGAEERPPTGLHALAQTVMPLAYGRNKRGNVYVEAGNRLESAASSYAGLAAALLLAPLAWTRRIHWSRNIGWIALMVISMSWVLNLPGFVSLWRLPGLNMFSFNRFVFAASFAVLALAVVGLDAIWRRIVRPQWWFTLPMAVVLGLGVWSAARATQTPPEPLGSQLEAFIESGRSTSNFRTMDDVRTAQANFRQSQWLSAGLCALTLAAWLVVVFSRRSGAPLGAMLGAMMVVEPLLLGHDVNPQCDRKLYYPPIGTLQQLTAMEPGRVVGYNCLPARLAEANGLKDIRGYDGVDPSRFIEMMRLAMDERSPLIPYALTQMYLPAFQFNDQGIMRMHPVMDLFNVRYVILRGRPDARFRTALVGDDYWIIQNPRALPRVFVPRRVELVTEDPQRLAKLGANSFDGRQVAFVEQPVEVPDRCQGTGHIESELPGELVLRARMETAGILVIADMWDPGWQASLSGQPLPVHRVNHVLRGVVLPAGESLVKFEYKPASFRLGVELMLGAGLTILAWAGAVGIRHKPAS